MVSRAALVVRTCRQTSAGFSLIELLVVTGILVVITSIVLASNAAFGGTVILRSLAYDMGLSIREAQTYGISVRQTTTGTFGAGYGMHLQTSSPTTYVFFADLDDNGYWEGSSEVVDEYTLNQGYQVSDLCVIPSGGGSETCDIAQLDILFKRPEPDAHIRAERTTGPILEDNQRARIVITSPRGDEASIVIEVTGQISVQ